MRTFEIKIEQISEKDHLRLRRLAKIAGLSLRNYVRKRLGIARRKRGNPTGNKGKKIKQPKRTA